jgi:Sigma-70, region 4
MTAPELIEISLPMPGLRRRLPLDSPKAATTIVSTLLGEQSLATTPVCEASVHLPRSGSIWVAAFTGPNAGQVWRSTGLTDHDEALRLTRKWEAEARAQRLNLGGTRSTPFLRIRREQPGSARLGPLTQREVAQLLKMSERGVRAVERRAFKKLRQHPLMRQVWQQFLAGELDEHQLGLTQEEIEALFNMARTPEERFLIEKVLRLIQR